jgi:hypothetical protein
MKINFLKSLSLYILTYSLIYVARLFTWREREDLGLYVDYWSEWPPTMKVSIILSWVLIALMPLLAGIALYFLFHGHIKRTYIASLSLLISYLTVRIYTLYSDLAIYPPSGGIVGKNLSESTIGWRLSTIGHISQTLLFVSMIALVVLSFIQSRREEMKVIVPVTSPQESLSLELARLGKLLDAGVITQIEFKAAKKKLLE